MTEDKKPGLKIRRKRKKEEEQSQAEAAAESAETEDSEATSDSGNTAKADAEQKAEQRRQARDNEKHAKAQPKGEHVRRSSFGEALKEREEQARNEPEPEATEEEEQEEEVQDEGPMPSTDDFAAMFGESAPAEVKEYFPGDDVEVEIIEITPDAVFVDLGPKREGVIDRQDLEDDEGELTVRVGETISAYVINRKGGQIQLSTALKGGDDAIEALKQASANGIPVEGRVASTNKGGYEVEMMNKSAFCPHSQIALGYTEDPDIHVGNTYRFKVDRVDERGNNIVVSRAALLREEREKQAEETKKKLKKDAELTGVVSRITEFGAFVDLGGIDGLVHISELGWTHVDHPSDVVEVGQPVNVKVIKLEEDGDELKIGLSMKELEEDPFVETMRKFDVGDSVNGKVTKLAPFGAFVEIAPGVEGLCHISEMVPGRRINHPQDVVEPGDQIEVQIIDTDPRKRTIGLSMKRLMEDPWAEAAGEYKPGKQVTGTVSSIQSFGIFITLPSGIDALLPLSHLDEGEEAGYRKHFSPGTEVEATVLDVDPDRERLTLTRKKDENLELEKRVSEYQESKSSEGFGTLGDLLKDKLK
jgi:small subunit ribosomal protein S1